MQESHHGRRGRAKAGAVVALAALATGLLALSASAAGPRRGSVDPATGYPSFYQDAIGTRVALCEAGPRCTPFDPAAQEGFYWSASAQMATPSGDKGAMLVLAKEAAVAPNGTTPIVFGRVRIRIDGLRPRATYRVTHPYGVKSLKTTGAGTINFTSDIGTANFDRALNSPVSKAYLRWDPRVTKAAAGFLGNVNFARPVVGSPRGTNYFKVEGPGLNRRGFIMSKRFFVEGQLAGPDTVKPLAPSAPNLAKHSDTGVRTDNVTADRTPTLAGRAEDAATVKVFVDGRLRARQFADNADYSVTTRLSRGVHRIKVTATDLAGNVSRLSAPLRIKIQ